MSVISYVLLGFAVIAAIDRVFGSRLGLGNDFEKGISMAGPLILAMGGMLVITPVLAELLSGLGNMSTKFFDFSLIPAVLLANDMGSSQIALKLSASAEVGLLNGFVVSAMMGCTVSFPLPYVIQVIKKEQHNDVMFGLLCGIITIPVGVIISGIIIGVDFVSLVFVLLPLLAFAGILAVGILKFEKITVKIFVILGLIMKGILTLGLIFGFAEFVIGMYNEGFRFGDWLGQYHEGFKVLSAAAPISSVMMTVASIIVVMVGAFPLFSLLERLLKKPLSMMGRRLGINDTSAFGMFVTLGTPLTTFEMAENMDRRGLILNSAFVVSASFMFMDHLAWTLAQAPILAGELSGRTVAATIAGKFISGIAAVAFAYFLCRGKKLSETDAAEKEIAKV